MPSPKRWFLEIRSYVGFGGKHCYGKIVSSLSDDEDWRKKAIEIERMIRDPEDANDLYPDWDLAEMTVGEKTNRFDHEDELIETAIRTWSNKKLGGQLWLGLECYDDLELLIEDEWDPWADE